MLATSLLHCSIWLSEEFLRAFAIAVFIFYPKCTDKSVGFSAVKNVSATPHFVFWALLPLAKPLVTSVHIMESDFATRATSRFFVCRVCDIISSIVPRRQATMTRFRSQTIKCRCEEIPVDERNLDIANCAVPAAFLRGWGVELLWNLGSRSRSVRLGYETVDDFQILKQLRNNIYYAHIYSFAYCFIDITQKTRKNTSRAVALFSLCEFS